jgi:hypothetical protein
VAASLLVAGDPNTWNAKTPEPASRFPGGGLWLLSSRDDQFRLLALGNAGDLWSTSATPKALTYG